MPPIIADFSLGDALLVTLEIFFLVIWIWILITVLVDLFRDHELSGWAKAAWVFFLIVLPFLGVLIYLIARGDGMRRRAVEEQRHMQQASEEYIRSVAPRPSTSSTDSTSCAREARSARRSSSA
jgi:ABC-type multidrug transport system fused ATPase/permease subunit